MQAVDSLDAMFDERPKEPSGISPDEVLAEYIRLDRLLKTTAADRQWYGSALMQKAHDERNGQKIVRLENSTRDQIVKLEYKSDWQIVDETEMETARELLGAERFNELFQIKYVPRVRALKTFLNTGSTDERVQTAKAIVVASVKEVEKSTPTLTVEKS